MHFAIPRSSTLLLALSLFVVARGVQADFLPNAYSLQVTGQQYSPTLQFLSDSSTASNTPPGPYGTTAELNVCASVSGCEGTLEYFGGYSDLATGALGGFIHSGGVSGITGVPSQEVMHAYLYRDLAFTGTGTATFTLHVQALLTTGGQSSYGAGETATAVSYNPNTGVADPIGSTFGAGGSIQQGLSSSLGLDATSIDKDVSIVLPIDAAHEYYTFESDIQLTAVGLSSVDGMHTASLSVQLSPGVTLDQTDGFLTQSGDPSFLNPPSTGTPEPRAVWPLFGLAVLALVFDRKRFARSR